MCPEIAIVHLGYAMNLGGYYTLALVAGPRDSSPRFDSCPFIQGSIMRKTNLSTPRRALSFPL
jgi:hypothetical protein